MGKASNKKKTAKLLRNMDRERYPDDEAHYIWLSPLLDAYHIQNTGIAVELEQESRKRNATVACRRGCTACCERPAVPLTEVELNGIIWYVTTKLNDSLRDTVKTQVSNRQKSLRCIFLVDNACAIYPVRPIACRILHVFGQECRHGDNVCETRPGEVWSHSRELGRRVAYALMPLYGITGKQNMDAQFDAGFLNNASVSMLEQPWDLLLRPGIIG
jgi:Fe-S-cluster containining protein